MPSRYKSCEAFYHSMEWKRCREAYVSMRGGLCERCLERGLYVPGKIVHHKQRLDDSTINDASVSLNFENLELLCQDCHAKEHAVHKKRFILDEFGHVSAVESPRFDV